MAMPVRSKKMAFMAPWRQTSGITGLASRKMVGIAHDRWYFSADPAPPAGWTRRHDPEPMPAGAGRSRPAGTDAGGQARLRRLAAWSAGYTDLVAFGRNVRSRH